MPGCEIHCEGVSKAYDGQQVLDNVHARIAPGEAVAVDDGSGKSTGESIIVSDRCDHGVIIDGVDTSTWREAQRSAFRRWQCAIIFQQRGIIPT